MYFSASYADAITSELLNFSMPTWVWWIILYAAFIALNAAGAAISFKFAIVVSIISIAIILVFSVMALFSGQFSWDKLFDIVPDPGQSAVPAARRAADPVRPAVRDVVLPRHRGAARSPPRSRTTRSATSPVPDSSARDTLIITGLLVLFLNTGVVGAEATGSAGEPLLDGFRAIVGDELAAILALFALIGLLASLQGIMFAYGRNMYSLSRAGYYPKFLSLTGKRQTPWVALAVGGRDRIHRPRARSDTLRWHWRSRRRDRAEHRDLGRGDRVHVADGLVHHPAQEVPECESALPQSRGAYPGAVIALVVSVLVFFGFFINESARPAIVAIAVVYVVILIGFALFFRHRLVLSPEEEYALSEGKHWDPQAEGYDAMENEVFGDKTDKPSPDSP